MNEYTRAMHDATRQAELLVGAIEDHGAANPEKALRAIGVLEEWSEQRPRSLAQLEAIVSRLRSMRFSLIPPPPLQLVGSVPKRDDRCPACGGGRTIGVVSTRWGQAQEPGERVCGRCNGSGYSKD